jgi:hypothetical protein
MTRLELEANIIVTFVVGAVVVIFVVVEIWR